MLAMYVVKGASRLEVEQIHVWNWTYPESVGKTAT